MNETETLWEIMQSASGIGQAAMANTNAELARLESENAGLKRALREAIEFAEEGWGYAGGYFREKWDYAGQFAALKAALEEKE
jgi:hypothetical protein